MTGRITYQPHRCKPGVTVSSLGPVRLAYPVGTEWVCDGCGKTWRMNILGWVPKAWFPEVSDDAEVEKP